MVRWTCASHRGASTCENESRLRGVATGVRLIRVELRDVGGPRQHGARRTVGQSSVRALKVLVPFPLFPFRKQARPARSARDTPSSSLLSWRRDWKAPKHLLCAVTRAGKLRQPYRVGAVLLGRVRTLDVPVRDPHSGGRRGGAEPGEPGLWRLRRLSDLVGYKGDHHGVL